MEEFFEDIGQDTLETESDLTALQLKIKELEEALEALNAVNIDDETIQKLADAIANREFRSNQELLEKFDKQYLGDRIQTILEKEDALEDLAKEAFDKVGDDLKGISDKIENFLKVKGTTISTTATTTTTATITTSPVLYFDLRHNDYRMLKTNLGGTKEETLLQNDVYKVERDSSLGAKVSRIDGKTSFDKILQFGNYKGAISNEATDDFEIILSWQAIDEDKKATLKAFWGLADIGKDPAESKSCWKDYFAIAEYLRDRKLYGSYGEDYSYNYEDLIFEPGSNWLKFRYSDGGKFGALQKIVKLKPEVVDTENVADLFDEKFEIKEESRIWEKGIKNPPEIAVGAVCIGTCINAELLLLAAKIS